MLREPQLVPTGHKAIARACAARRGKQVRQGIANRADAKLIAALLLLERMSELRAS
jgi:hypothetical protein